VDFRGFYFTVENARLYTAPEEPPPIMLAASGEKSAMLAARQGEGLIATSPDEHVVRTFKEAGGEGRPLFAQVTVCWAADEREARKTAHQFWPTAALQGQLSQELALPAYFEQAAASVTEDDVAKLVVCGPEVQAYINAIQKFTEAGFDHIYLHQVGLDQEGFFSFAERELLPRLRQLRVAA
jgi:G6PDH family F420-dependent oxidoreductase